MAANSSSNIHAGGERSVAMGGNVSNSAIITGDVFIQFVIFPVRRVRFDYAVNIGDFLHSYLGTPQNPVPFGGHEEALRALDAWLDDTTQPYALLTAPAGRGKLALLVR